MDFMVPRRARMKKPRCEVQGVSYAEQRLIEKALKESLRDSQKKPNQEQPEVANIETRDEPTTIAIESISDQKPGYKYLNVAKKSAPTQKMKPGRKRQKAVPLEIEDPIYRPTGYSSISKLPPKHTIERHSKAITNIKLDLSTEDNDSSQSPTPSPSPPPPPLPTRKRLTSEKKSRLASSNPGKAPNRIDSVIIISDSSEGASDWSSDTEDESFSLETTMKQRDKSRDGSIQNRTVTNISPARKNADISARPQVKTQKILFKAIKKSSAVAPLGVFNPNIKLEKETLETSVPVSSSNSTKYQSPQHKRPKASTNRQQQHLHSPISSSPPTPKRFHTVSDLFGSSRPDSCLFSNFSLSSDDSSDATASSRQKDSSNTPCTSTPTKDTDRSSFQAQRKFASNSIPSNLSNGFHSPVIDTEMSQTIPSTEDFLLFLCLRSSGKIPDSLKFFNSPWTPHSHRPRSRLPRLSDRTLRPVSLAREMAANIPSLR